MAAISSTTDPGVLLIKAMAHRKKGILLRDLYIIPESIAALKEAHACVKLSGLTSSRSQLEIILDLAELAGSIDYIGDNEVTANVALALPKAFFGCYKDRSGQEQPVNHPVTALCMTGEERK